MPHRLRTTAPRARTIRHLRAGAEMPLFFASLAGATDDAAVVDLADGNARLYRGWLPAARADALAAEVRAHASWLQERRVMYDRVVDVPREQSWFGDARAWMRASADAELDDGATGDPSAPATVVRPWTPELARVRDLVESIVAARFAYVLVNRYRDGRDSVAWHNDRTNAALPEPAIASLSLGAVRVFDVRAKDRPRDVVSIDLAHGDLLVMRGAMQARFDHRVRKDPRVAAERLNLTFRECRP